MEWSSSLPSKAKKEKEEEKDEVRGRRKRGEREEQEEEENVRLHQAQGLLPKHSTPPPQLSQGMHPDRNQPHCLTPNK